MCCGSGNFLCSKQNHLWASRGGSQPRPGRGPDLLCQVCCSSRWRFIFCRPELARRFSISFCVSRAGWRRRQFTPLPGLDGKVGGQFRVLIILGELARDWLMHSKFVVRLKILLAQLKIRRRGVGRTFYGLGGEQFCEKTVVQRALLRP